MSERILEMTIEELDLSVRSYNCLKRAKFDTVEKICEVTEEELLIKTRNLGRKSLEEVVQKLLCLGLCLKDAAHSTITNEKEIGLEEYNFDDDTPIDWGDDFEISETNRLSTDRFCTTLKCEFREVCYLDKTYCVKECFNSILKMLTLQEEQVIRLRYGIDCDRIEDFSDIGKKISICTRERVKQIEARALRKLRNKDISCLIRVLFPTIFSTSEETSYSKLVKNILGLSGNNAELLKTEVIQTLQIERIEKSKFHKI